MKAVVWQGGGDIRLEDVPEPKIQVPKPCNILPNNRPVQLSI
jgi:hypothetical protein